MFSGFDLKKLHQQEGNSSKTNDNKVDMYTPTHME